MKTWSRLPVPREHRRAFWRDLRAHGRIPVAAQAAGITTWSAQAWIRKAGGMPDVSLVKPTGRLLSFTEREEIALQRAEGASARQIARVLGRAPSTITRELAAGTHPDVRRYKASVAHRRAEERLARPKPGKLASNPALAAWVSDHLAGNRPGTAMARAWSPQQISRHLRVEFPDDEGMRVSHEAIYQSLYVLGRGGLRKELHTALRTGRAVRRPQAITRASQAGRPHALTPEVLISARPAEVTDRAVPGHWEGDLITGTRNGSAIGTLVERQTRFLMLLHLPDGHGAQQVAAAMREQITQLPAHLRRSMTWDQGREMTPFAGIQIVPDLDLWFCDPHSPWQRGTNENTNGLLRQYFPKGTDLRVHTAQDLADVALVMNERPRKVLDWRSPYEAMSELLLADTTGVATTD
jgi:transposase, IS30 family